VSCAGSAQRVPLAGHFHGRRQLLRVVESLVVSCHALMNTADFITLGSSVSFPESQTQLVTVLVVSRKTRYGLSFALGVLALVGDGHLLLILSMIAAIIGRFVELPYSCSHQFAGHACSQKPYCVWPLPHADAGVLAMAFALLVCIPPQATTSRCSTCTMPGGPTGKTDGGRMTTSSTSGGEIGRSLEARVVLCAVVAASILTRFC
jgi:hypothetical protein